LLAGGLLLTIPWGVSAIWGFNATHRCSEAHGATRLETHTTERGSLPAAPDFTAELERVTLDVQRCIGTPSRVVDVRVRISGTGDPTSVHVAPPLADTPEAACIAEVLLRARFPRFRATSVETTYRFPPLVIGTGQAAPDAGSPEDAASAP